MRARTLDGSPLVPGVNVDPVDIAAGLAEAKIIGYDSAQDEMVVVYALQRWQRGEEAGAEKTALGHGVDFTSWRRILAAAVAKGTEELERRGRDG